MTTTASKRMRIAALGLSTALSVGVLAPFIGTSSASAVTCSTASSNVAHANTKLAKDKAKLHKAKKRLRKARHAHKAPHVIRHDKRAVKRAKHRVKVDRRHKAAALAAQRNCGTAGTGTNNPAGTANPLTSILGTLTGSGLSSKQLTDALDSITSQLQSSGAPGAAQLADALKQVSAAITSGSSSIDPSKFQDVLNSLPADLDPAKFQDALTKAAAALQSSLATPPSTPDGLVDAILNPLIQGLSNFDSAAPLKDLLTQVKTALDDLLNQIANGGTGSLPLG